MAIFKVQESLLYSRAAGADLSEKLNYLAHVDTDGDIVLAGAGEHVIGVIYEAAGLAKQVTVQFGGIAKVVLGATVAAGARVASDSAGKAVTATSNQFEVGTALEGGAVNEVVPVALISGRAA